MPGRLKDLTRRERQIMDVIWRRGQATAAEVQEELPDPPSYSAVRAMLVKLERKGHLNHAQDGPRYVYVPVVPAEEARESALDRLVSTFFGGSTLNTVAALLDRTTEGLTTQELDRLEALIDRARKGGQ